MNQKTFYQVNIVNYVTPIYGNWMQGRRTEM
jgi:hypothetical protein